MSTRLDRNRVVSQYVRSRLAMECSVRGRAARIAEKTGFSRMHVSNVVRGNRLVGETFARAMAALWQLDYEALVEAAFQAHALDYVPPASAVRDRPNLRATLDWCQHHEVYPRGFLRRYERDIEREGRGGDRSAREWMFDLEAKHQAFSEEKLRAAAGAKRVKGERLGGREERSGTFAKHGESPEEVRPAKTGRAAK